MAQGAFIGVVDSHHSGMTAAGARLHLAKLKAFVKDRLAPYKYPRFIEFVSDLPKTATGKIQRFKLRAQESTGSAA